MNSFELINKEELQLKNYKKKAEKQVGLTEKPEKIANKIRKIFHNS